MGHAGSAESPRAQRGHSVSISRPLLDIELEDSILPPFLQYSA